MDTPKVIYIGHADYEIREKRQFDLLGETDNIDGVITLRKKQGAACKRDTLLHEVLHATIWMSGYGHGMESEAEEKLVRALTPWLLAALRDNPSLVEFLVKDAKESA